jgi:hypothetical protein
MSKIKTKNNKGNLNFSLDLELDKYCKNGIIINKIEDEWKKKAII